MSKDVEKNTVTQSKGPDIVQIYSYLVTSAKMIPVTPDSEQMRKDYVKDVVKVPYKISDSTILDNFERTWLDLKRNDNYISILTISLIHEAPEAYYNGKPIIINIQPEDSNEKDNQQ